MSVDMTAADLKSRTVRDLASMAKRKKVPGWHSMKKDELVHALVRHAKSDKVSPNGNGHSKP
jgi:transcription termination factor Rho